MYLSLGSLMVFVNKGVLVLGALGVDTFVLPWSDTDKGDNELGKGLMVVDLVGGDEDEKEVDLDLVGGDEDEDEKADDLDLVGGDEDVKAVDLDLAGGSGGSILGLGREVTCGMIQEQSGNSNN